MHARLERYGVEIPPQRWKRLSNESLNHALLSTVGLEDIEVTRHDLSYALADAEGWWEVVWNAGFRSLLSQLSEADLTRFRAELLAEIAALGAGQGVPLRVEVLYARGVAGVTLFDYVSTYGSAFFRREPTFCCRFSLAANQTVSKISYIWFRLCSGSCHWLE